MSAMPLTAARKRTSRFSPSRAHFRPSSAGVAVDRFRFAPRADILPRPAFYGYAPWSIMSDFDRFGGIPYLDRGRASAGCDYYGLLRLIMLELRRIEFPSFLDQRSANVGSGSRRRFAPTIEVDQLRPRLARFTARSCRVTQRVSPSHSSAQTRPGRHCATVPTGGRPRFFRFKLRSDTLTQRVSPSHRSAQTRPLGHACADRGCSPDRK
jgi:hypothetical protein